MWRRSAISGPKRRSSVLGGVAPRSAIGSCDLHITSTTGIEVVESTMLTTCIVSIRELPTHINYILQSRSLLPHTLGSLRFERRPSTSSKVICFSIFLIWRHQRGSMSSRGMETSFAYVAALGSYRAWLLIAVVSTLSSFLLTFLFTSARATLMSRIDKGRKRPPIDWYIVPYFAHAYRFVLNFQRLATFLITRYGRSVPVSLRLGPWKAVLVADPAIAETLVRAPRGLMTIDGILLAMGNILGQPAHPTKSDLPTPSLVCSSVPPRAGTSGDDGPLYVNHDPALRGVRHGRPLD